MEPTNHEPLHLPDSKNTGYNIVRDKHLCDRVVFLDGLTGTGKTMLAPILSSLQDVEIPRIDHNYEFLGTLHFLKRIQTDAAIAMMRISADLSLYNLNIGREVNLRYSDLTSVFSNPRTFHYIRRLFLPDGQEALKRIKGRPVYLNIITHQALGVITPAFEAFGKGLRVIEMVRHPYYLLEHWETYIHRYGNDPGDFTLWIDFEGKTVPWFSQGWEKKYLSSTNFDRVIYSIEALTLLKQQALHTLKPQQQKQVLTIPFERFVLDPKTYVDKICQFLATWPGAFHHSVLLKQKLPRKRISDGPNKSIYRRYSWKMPHPGISDQEEFEAKQSYAKKNASKEAWAVLQKLAEEYEETFGLWF